MIRAPRRLGSAAAPTPSTSAGGASSCLSCRTPAPSGCPLIFASPCSWPAMRGGAASRCQSPRHGGPAAGRHCSKHNYILCLKQCLLRLIPLPSLAQLILYSFKIPRFATFNKLFFTSVIYVTKQNNFSNFAAEKTTSHESTSVSGKL